MPLTPNCIGPGDMDDLGLQPDLIEDRPKSILSQEELRLIKGRNRSHGIAATQRHDEMIKRKKRYRRM